MVVFLSGGCRGIRPHADVEVLRLDDQRHQHRTAPQPTVDPAAERAPDRLLERVRVAHAVVGGIRERGDDLRLDVLEHRVVLGEAARVDLWPDDDLARRGVDDDDDRDEPLAPGRPSRTSGDGKPIG